MISGHKLRMAYRVIAQFPSFLTFMVLGFVPALRARSAKNPWVISGHKGRIYEDNCRALHEYITSNTDQAIIWISSSDKLTQKLRQKGHRVLTKHSFAARRAILSAPVLIYSHGEDDLDSFMILWRKVLGVRFLLRHGLTHLKGPKIKQSKLFLTDFDWMLASSNAERDNFRKFLPESMRERVVLGGGAHLDRFVRLKGCQPERLIFYFPTHRESVVGRITLRQNIEEILSSKLISNWLRATGYKFAIGRHINSNYSELFDECGDIRLVEPEAVVDYMLKAELFISDYSALLSTYLLLNRPCLFFPYDLEAYASLRHFYCNYESFCYGSAVYTVAELVDYILRERWKENEDPHIARRESLIRRFFSYSDPRFAERTYKTIALKVSRLE